LRECPPNPMINEGGMFGCFDITATPGFFSELRYVIRPESLMTNSAFRRRFNAIPNLRATVRLDRVFDHPFIIINEKSRRPEGFRVHLFHFFQLNSRGNRVRRAAVEPVLMINGWAIGPEIDPRWQSADQFGRRTVEEIA